MWSPPGRASSSRSARRADLVAAVAAVIVGVVLLSSGAIKLARPRVWRAAAAGMGVTAPVAAVVPAVEVVIGAFLTAQLWLGVLGWVAAALLVAFTVVLIVHLIRGRRPPCACFGSAARRISWWDVARNAVLIALAVSVALAG